MMHYSRIHSDKINPLIKEAFNLNKSMHDNGIFTWYTFAKEIFAEFEIDKRDFEAFSRLFKIAKISIKKICLWTLWKTINRKLSLNNDSSKLFLYSKLKSDIKLEEYLKSERNFKNRQLLTKFHLSYHNLEIELGQNGANMFMGQWRYFSWNIHHTVSISLLKTLHLFQHDTFFSIYWYFSYQYILVLSFSKWPIYFL